MGRQGSGGVRVLLSNPGWEKWLVKFLELSRVGRTIADETYEYEARAERMDGIMWETEERVTGDDEIDSFFFSSFYMFRGTHTPGYTHSAMLRVEDFFCLFLCVLRREDRSGFLGTCGLHMYPLQVPAWDMFWLGGKTPLQIAKPSPQQALSPRVHKGERPVPRLPGRRAWLLDACDRTSNPYPMYN